MDLPEPLWNELKDRLDPATVAEGDIERISISITNGGIKARTIEPIYTPDHDPISSDFDPEEDDPQDFLSEMQEKSEQWSQELDEQPENEEVFIHDELGIEIKSIVMEGVREGIVRTPTLSSTRVVRCTAEDGSIYPVVRLSHTIDDNWVMDDLAESLAAAGDIESEDKLAYGEIDSCYYIGEDDIGTPGWELDGTLYRYTDEPFKYWSEGPDSDYPNDIEEWAEFASDSEAQREEILTRNSHVVHFHPMKRGLSEDNPLIEWHNEVEDAALTAYELDKSIVTDSYLRTVRFDRSEVNLEVHIIL